MDGRSQKQRQFGERTADVVCGERIGIAFFAEQSIRLRSHNR